MILYGKLIGLLGILVSLNAICALLLPIYSLTLFFCIDEILKIVFGGLMIKLAPINF
ncbi:DUF6609 family protein [Carnobacterium gallinarum]|uniref:DUF6609 family protein n=1 Tax=Carnobacterium gallinarum TaxID=2749 RepID=UPI003CCC254B